jgi:hypothetical protein
MHMGATDFVDSVSAATATLAFERLVREARYQHGHGGYTGTIAEKAEFRIVEPRAGETPGACVDRCLSDSDHWVADKFGPAACLDTGPDPKTPGHRVFVFFGVASH